MERFLATAPVTWSPDGRHVAYEQPLRRTDPHVDVMEYEIRIRDIRNQRERRLAVGPNRHGRHQETGLHT
jgi:hypothetical protein